MWTVLVDFLAWLIIHISVSQIIAHPSADLFDPDGWLYRERRWERHGRTYEVLFKVKSWKEILPDGAALFESGFRKKRLQKVDAGYIRAFIRETCRAEITHWTIFAFAAFFFIWNTWWVGIIMILYAVTVNMPCIITQRYNRIRLTRLLCHLLPSSPSSAVATDACDA
jgi:glycosyl-4,4'-diaponeurosporenoate acyltransferase